MRKLVVICCVAVVTLTGCNFNKDKFDRGVEDFTVDANEFTEEILDPNADTGVIPKEATESGTKWFGDGSDKGVTGDIYHTIERSIWK